LVGVCLVEIERIAVPGRDGFVGDLAFEKPEALDTVLLVLSETYFSLGVESTPGLVFLRSLFEDCFQEFSVMEIHGTVCICIGFFITTHLLSGYMGCQFSMKLVSN
jgi:hypothetical protein